MNSTLDTCSHDSDKYNHEEKEKCISLHSYPATAFHEVEVEFCLLELVSLDYGTTRRCCIEDGKEREISDRLMNDINETTKCCHHEEEYANKELILHLFGPIRSYTI